MNRWWPGGRKTRYGKVCERERDRESERVRAKSSGDKVIKMAWAWHPMIHKRHVQPPFMHCALDGSTRKGRES